MQEYKSSFIVPSSIQNVAAFHGSPEALTYLPPPPMKVRFDFFEPVKEGSRVDFTMSFWPIKIHWLARHKNVNFPHQFTDEQVSGPMKAWAHTHSFLALSEKSTQVTDSILYEYKPGLPGLFSRFMFNPIMLSILFMHRHRATIKICSKM